MIRYLQNVLLGNFSRWNSTHNKVVRDIWGGVISLDSVSQAIAGEVLVKSMTIVETYLGPSRKGHTMRNLPDGQVKSLEYEDFFRIYEGLMKLFIKLLSVRNDVLAPYSEVVIYHFFQKRLSEMDDLEKLDKDCVQEIVAIGLNRFIAASKILQGGDPILTFSLSTLVLQIIEPMERQILNDIKSV